jgi:hypothetical protein
MLNTFAYLREYCKQLKMKYPTYDKKLSDWDSFAPEVIQVFIMILVVNVIIKYQSSKI